MPKTPFKHFRLQTILPWLLAAVSTVLLTGCPFDTRQSSLDPKGPIAQMQYDLFMLTVWVTLGIFIVVGGVLVWAVIRFRERPGDENKPLPHQGHGNPLVEASLIGASVALLVLIAIPTLEGIWFQYELPEDPESHLGSWYQGRLSPDDRDDVLEINVIGYQWWWAFEYPQFGITTGNEMVIPTGKVVKLNLRSADVIHSFWLPKIAGKVDLIPGRRNWMWIQSDESGHYYGQCAEFCGEAHAYMMFRVDSLDSAEFSAWVQRMQQAADTLPDVGGGPLQVPADFDAAKLQALEGKKLFLEKTCVRCHTVSGNSTAQVGVLGPNLSNVASRRSLAAGFMDHQAADGSIDRDKQFANLVEWIYHPQDIKPGNLMYHRGGLESLMLSGITYNRMHSVGITDDDLRRIGLSAEKISEIKANPDADISAELSNRQIEALHSNLTYDQQVGMSNYITREEAEKIAAYLLTLH